MRTYALMHDGQRLNEQQGRTEEGRRSCTGAFSGGACVEGQRFRKESQKPQAQGPCPGAGYQRNQAHACTLWITNARVGARLRSLPSPRLQPRRWTPHDVLWVVPAVAAHPVPRQSRPGCRAPEARLEHGRLCVQAVSGAGVRAPAAATPAADAVLWGGGAISLPSASVRDGAAAGGRVWGISKWLGNGR